MDEQTRQWLESGREDPIDPDREICDSHHHLWDTDADTYLVDELHADTGAGHNVTSTVFVECMSSYRTDGPDARKPVGETEFVVEQARQAEAAGGATIGAIVGRADLALGDAVGEVLDAHIDAGDGRFAGIRHATAFDEHPDVRRSHTKPTAGLMGTDAFRAGFAQLGPRGLRFDAWLYHPQIPELTALARAFPQTPIVLDHIGGPLGLGRYQGDREATRAEWRPAIAELASCANVTVKLGGIGMPVFGQRFHKAERPPSSAELADTWGPELTFCIESFGVERAMFESNFPVDRASTSYTTLWNCFQRVAAGASDAEADALFRTTAHRFYGVAEQRVGWDGAAQ